MNGNGRNDAEFKTVNCLKCGKPVPYTEGTCPHCGYVEFKEPAVAAQGQNDAPGCCDIAKKIIARQGNETAVKANGDCTELYWHIESCSACANLRHLATERVGGSPARSVEARELLCGNCITGECITGDHDCNRIACQCPQVWCVATRKELTALPGPSLPSEETRADDRAILEVIDERDALEELIGDLALLLGCREEWSSLHDHKVCVVEAVHELKAGSNYVADDAVYPTRIEFANGRVVAIKSEEGRWFLGVGNERGTK